MRTDTTETSRSRGQRGGKFWRAIVTVVLLGFVGVVVQQVAFSGASISWKTGNPGSTQNAGTFSFNSTKDGQVIIAAARMKPGDSQSGNVTLTGAGDYSGVYVLTRTGLVDSPTDPAFSAALHLKVEDVDAGRVFYNGTLSGFTSVALGTIAVGESAAYTLTLTFPTSGANPALQGATTTATLAFTAVAQ
jgi:spore coat-associated protein N